MLQRLGSGGMGEVYLAQQRRPKRKVAVKVLRGPRSRQLRRRFVGEWQALARLNHPNVAALYEVGVGSDSPELDHDGPYVAMEWVDGPPLTVRCDRDRIDLTARLRIFLDVCRGVSHAHEKGILHCDLKPGNILLPQLEGRYVPKIVDFGISRALDGSLDGGREKPGGLVIGSPPYISPEAAIGGDDEHSLDVRTDVYALGLVLYELIAGVLPFDLEGMGLLSALRHIIESETTEPADRFAGLKAEERDAIAAARSTSADRLKKRLRGDLDAIVRKATARDPRRRYSSPSALADDIARYLDRRPVDAKPHTPAYVIRRFAQRHAPGMAAAGLVFLALVGGFVGRSMEAARAQRALAESEQIRMFLLDLFENADPERAAGSALTVDELLQQGTERLRTDLHDLPRVRAELLQTIGTVSTKLDQLGAAEEAIREALEIRRQLFAEDHPEVLASRNELGVILRRLGRFEEAETLLAAVLDVRRRDPNVDLESLARAHSNLGNVYFSQRRYAEAETRHREALRLRTERNQTEDTSETRNNVAISASNLGVMLRMQHKHAQAREPLLQAVDIFRRENLTLLGSALNNLGLVEQYLPTWRRAEGLFREATQVLEQSLGSSHSRALRSRRNLIFSFLDQLRIEEALEESRLALNLAESSEDQLSRARVWETVGVAQHQAGQMAAAAESHRRCVDLASAIGGPGHPVARKCLGQRAFSKAAAGDRAAALADLEELMELEGAAASEYAESSIYKTYFELGQFEEAASHIERYRELTGGRNDGFALSYLARARQGQGEIDEARRLFEQAMHFMQRRYGPDHPQALRLTETLATLSGATDPAPSAPAS
ncbi:MAG: tetratricopeptide repeat protein [Acidobacteriota bacterium]